MAPVLFPHAHTFSLDFHPIRNYPEPLSSNCLLHKEIEPSSFFSGRHV